MAYKHLGGRGRGDPGIGSFLKGAVRGVARVAGTVLPGPAGALARGASSLLRSSPARPQQIPVMPAGGLRGMVQRAVPGGSTGLVVGGGHRKRRKMNPGNTKALTRASRRMDSFVRVAKKALKHTNYTVVTKGSRRGKKDLGAGHGHVR